MAKCKYCGKKIDKKTEDYQNEAIKIPLLGYFRFFRIRYNYQHSKCMGVKRWRI